MPEASDARMLQKANHDRETLETITPIATWRHLHLIARRDCKTRHSRIIDVDDVPVVRTSDSSLLVVEGAGGFYSPIAEDGLNADLAGQLGLQVVIVVDDRIGAVNQSLMTIEAVEKRGLSIATIILNEKGKGRGRHG